MVLKGELCRNSSLALFCLQDLCRVCLEVGLKPGLVACLGQEGDALTPILVQGQLCL